MHQPTEVEDAIWDSAQASDPGPQLEREIDHLRALQRLQPLPQRQMEAGA